MVISQVYGGIVHINAEFVDQTSDHDPQVVRFRFFPLYALLP